MTVTDPDVPDPRGDPRTLQADPGAYGEGADLASAEDDPASTGDEELDAEADLATERTRAELGHGDTAGGASAEAPPS
jgi:hypothetical protein